MSVFKIEGLCECFILKSDWILCCFCVWLPGQFNLLCAMLVTVSFKNKTAEYYSQIRVERHFWEAGTLSRKAMIRFSGCGAARTHHSRPLWD